MGKVGWQGATKENIPSGSSTEEQRSQPAFTAKTRRASDLLSSASVGSVLTARCGDAPWPVRHGPSPPWHTPKSLSAGPLGIFRQALSVLTTFAKGDEAIRRLFLFQAGRNPKSRTRYNLLLHMQQKVAGDFALFPVRSHALPELCKTRACYDCPGRSYFARFYFCR